MIEKQKGEKDLSKTAIVAVTAILALTIAFSDFCIGGVNMIYIYDVSVIVAMISAAILMNLTEKSEGCAKPLSGIMTAALSLMSVWTNLGVVETIRKVLS